MGYSSWLENPRFNLSWRFFAIKMVGGWIFGMFGDVLVYTFECKSGWDQFVTGSISLFSNVSRWGFPKGRVSFRSIKLLVICTLRERRYPLLRKGKSSTRKCFEKGYVSSQEGSFISQSCHVIACYSIYPMQVSYLQLLRAEKWTITTLG